MTNTNTNIRANWLAERRKSVGGSDAAAVMGVSPYATPYTVWANKTQRLPEVADNEPIRLGRDLEYYVAARFAEHTGKKVRRHNKTIRNPRYPYSHANVDRVVVGEKAGLECKTCSPFRLGDFTDTTYPPEYHIQCLHYLAVTGFAKWYLAVLVWGYPLKVYEINRSDFQDDIDEIQQTIHDFWTGYVIPNTPPPPDGEAATSKAINQVLSESSENIIDITCEDSFVNLAQVKQQISALEREKELCVQQIKLAMGKSEKAVCGPWVAQWKPRKDGVRMFSVREG